MDEELICVSSTNSVSSTECGPGCCGPVQSCNPDDDDDD